MSEPSLVEVAKRISAERRLENGSGRTSKFFHEVQFPSIVTLEEVAGGLIGDISGREDILERAPKTSEDASVEMIYAKLEAVLRARLFGLVAEVVPQFLKEARENRATEWELNVLLRLMAEVQPPAIYQEHEAITLATNVNRLNDSEWTTEDVLGYATRMLQRACRPKYERDQTEQKYEGLVPVRVDRGIAFDFVPVRHLD